jgi:hypothetical protein
MQTSRVLVGAKEFDDGQYLTRAFLNPHKAVKPIIHVPRTGASSKPMMTGRHVALANYNTHYRLRCLEGLHVAVIYRQSTPQDPFIVTLWK